jgi:hypothetical protein
LKEDLEKMDENQDNGGNVKKEPKITVGIMDWQTEVSGRLDGNFRGDGFDPVSGWFSGKATVGMIILSDESHREIIHSLWIRFIPNFLAG